MHQLAGHKKHTAVFGTLPSHLLCVFKLLIILPCLQYHPDLLAVLRILPLLPLLILPQ